MDVGVLSVLDLNVLILNVENYLHEIKCQNIREIQYIIMCTFFLCLNNDNYQSGINSIRCMDTFIQGRSIAVQN